MSDANSSSASIEDVARLAQVSIATVSRSLRGLPEVAPLTRDRVLAAARELNYVASPFAARLASGRTFTVGVVVPFVDRWFFAAVLGAVEAELRRAGYDLLLYNLNDVAGRERFFEVMPVRKRVDAVLVVSLSLSVKELAALRALKMPIGLVGNDVPGFFTARIDDVDGAARAVSHLTGLGHARIGLIGGDIDDPMRFTPPLYRRDGYLAALAAADIEVDASLEALGYFTVAGGEQAMAILLDRPHPPTAVFAESDEMAYGAIKTIRRRGLRIPDDVAVIGFDDRDTSELLDLSTVRQPVHDQGSTVARALLDAAQGAASAGPGAVLPTELVVRGSTDASKTCY